MQLYDTLSNLASRLDDLPVSPSSLADRAMDRFVARRTKRAASDPAWAAIQARRLDPTRPASIIFLSNDLTLADAGEQDRIAERLTPDPVWLGLARHARHWRLARLLGSSRRSVQRARRGWADTDTFSLHTHLCEIMAGMLKHLAETAHGWPESEEFPTPESWIEALRANAAALAAYAAGTNEQALTHWHDLATARDTDPAALEQARLALNAQDTERDAAGAAAMHWVADHLGALWD
jgi:hypothetical protein